MQIQVHSDNHISGSVRLAEWVTDSVACKLEWFEEDLSRVIVHLNDENGDKAGPDDKRCQIEARPKGQQPISVTHKANGVEFAVEGALEKLYHALEHHYGKLNCKRPHTAPFEGLVGSNEVRDALLEADFLADEQLRSA